MATERTRRRLLKVLTELSSGASHPAVTERLRLAFLDFGSETPDNVACAEKLRVGSGGLGLRGRRWLVGDVIYEAEGIPIPRPVKKRFPGITKKEWAAVQRLASIVFYALEKDL